ncbi:glycosyltransferase family 4 protein [Niabella pedocola]|uniref:Glycosyltransferase family 4 protein n=1 Tax=Niabella pedocola TaxID=1752077 RepID=A0ABS8PY29_9BACT|nr:glycosyltransferase family 4 protein [Niabella pedocola]MCD2425981.1 glycosyltransferase family 4 protein [Niabella pedocola]
MINKTKILYFMADPITRRDAGNRTHVLQMLEYFNSRHEYVELDYVGVKEWGDWNNTDYEEFNRLFPHCNLHTIKLRMPKDNIFRYYFKSKLPNQLRKKRAKRNGNAVIDDYTTVHLHQNFNELLQKKKYDCIIMSYVTWSTLLENNPNVEGVKLIIDTHDFMTAQFKGRAGFQLGKTFEREMKLLSIYNETWSQSADEQYLFSQFLPVKHRFVPIMYKDNSLGASLVESQEYDLIYVGSENDNNQQSINWFFNTVYPLLPKDIRICVIGKICDYFPSFPNVEKHLFVYDLSEYYHKAKLAICPMLNGTGVKVKVVEAMSYGLPIVCNLRGLDGLPIKDGNGCLRADSPEEFAHGIQSLLTDDKYRSKISEKAKETFNTFFEINKCYKDLDKVFNISLRKENRVRTLSTFENGVERRALEAL